MELNLLLSIMFKALSKVDVRIARSFPVLCKLIKHIKVTTYMKHDNILQPHDTLSDIKVIYSGNVKQQFVDHLSRPSEFLMSEDVLGLKRLQDRATEQPCRLEVKVMSK